MENFLSKILSLFLLALLPLGATATTQTDRGEVPPLYENEASYENEAPLPPVGSPDEDEAALPPVETTDEEGVVLPPVELSEQRSDFRWQEFAVPAATAAVGGLFVKTPKLVQARTWVQRQLANPTGQSRTNADDYLQFLPLATSYGLYAFGMKGEHNFVDRTILAAMSYATFAIVNNTLKWTVSEPRPDNPTQFNSFPSNHAGIAFVGAELLRREYWNQNKWVAMSGYVVGVAVAYLRVYNNRHWINDVVTGASLGYLSTAFSYWLYPKIFCKRDSLRRQQLSASFRPAPDVSIYAVPSVSTDYFGATALITF